MPYVVRVSLVQLLILCGSCQGLSCSSLWSFTWGQLACSNAFAVVHAQVSLHQRLLHELRLGWFKRRWGFCLGNDRA